MSSFHDMARLEDQLQRAEDEAKSKHLQQKLKNKFQNRFEKKPWLIRQKGNRTIVKYASWTFQFISIAAGFYGAKIIMEFLPLPVFAQWIAAALVLVFIEILKRKYSDQFWDSVVAFRKALTTRIRWGSGIANVSLFIVSIGLSVGGVYFGVIDFSPDNPDAIALNEKIETAKADLAAWKKDPANLVSNGQVKWNLRKIPQQKEESIIALETAYFDQFGTYAPSSDWDLRNEFRRWFSVIATILAELLFEGCMLFASFYDLRYALAMGYVRREEEQKVKSLKSKKAVALTA